MYILPSDKSSLIKASIFNQFFNVFIKTILLFFIVCQIAVVRLLSHKTTENIPLILVFCFSCRCLINSTRYAEWTIIMWLGGLNTAYETLSKHISHNSVARKQLDCANCTDVMESISNTKTGPTSDTKLIQTNPNQTTAQLNESIFELDRLFWCMQTKKANKANVTDQICTKNGCEWRGKQFRFFLFSFYFFLKYHIHIFSFAIIVWARMNT